MGAGQLPHVTIEHPAMRQLRPTKKLDRMRLTEPNGLYKNRPMPHAHTRARPRAHDTSEH
eukprot:4561352-Pyramimonas_sp.AAC.1